MDYSVLLRALILLIVGGLMPFTLEMWEVVSNNGKISIVVLHLIFLLVFGFANKLLTFKQ